MKINNLGVDDVVLELDEKDMAQTREENIKEANRTYKEVQSEQAKMEVVEEDSLDLSGAVVVPTEERVSKAIDLLDKEKMLQEDREKEWIKEKKHKRFVRRTKITIWVVIVLILLFAWLSGYRIPVPDSWVDRAQEIYQSAYNFVVGYFTGTR